MLWSKLKTTADCLNYSNAVKDVTQVQLGDIKSASLFVSAQLVAPQTLNICAEGGCVFVCVCGVGGLMAGHKGRASSPSVCQPT